MKWFWFLCFSFLFSQVLTSTTRSEKQAKTFKANQWVQHIKELINIKPNETYHNYNNKIKNIHPDTNNMSHGK